MNPTPGAPVPGVLIQESTQAEAAAVRLVTRADMDGLTCAVLVTTCEQIGETVLIHPQDITDKRFAVTPEDILANLPYAPGCAKWFDHHLLTASNELPPAEFDGRYGLAPSAARNVYDYYLPRHPEIQEHATLVAEADRLDAAQLTRDDVLDPRGYILLGLTLDPRTGLGAYQDYFHLLLGELRAKHTVAAVLDRPEVGERVERMRALDVRFRAALQAHSRVDANVVITDLRGLDPVPVGNRFVVYTLFPGANISLRVHRGPRPETVALAVGHSIFDRSSRTNVGVLMSRYGGGGHRGAGTCLIPAARADELIAEIVAVMKKDG
jgi:hypothetical protein